GSSGATATLPEASPDASARKYSSRLDGLVFESAVVGMFFASDLFGSSAGGAELGCSAGGGASGSPAGVLGSETGALDSTVNDAASRDRCTTTRANKTVARTQPTHSSRNRFSRRRSR